MIDPLWLLLAAAVLIACAVFLWRADPGKREWAKKRGYEFKKTDEYLADEWTRGAAASGAVPKEVVRGLVDGREIYLAKLGNVSVAAMRKAVASDAVLDFRKFESESDLMPVTEVAGFKLFSNEVDIASRAIDERMTAALEAIPADAVWAESDWVLAQYSETEPEKLFEPLMLFADAATALPARARVPLQPLDPTRAMIPPRVSPVEEPAEPARLLRVEHVDKPLRAVPRALGVVEPRPVGVDDIDAIAEGPAKLPESDGTRIVRRDDGSTIF